MRTLDELAVCSSHDTAQQSFDNHSAFAGCDENYNLLRILSDGTKEVMALRPAFDRYHAEVGE